MATTKRKTKEEFVKQSNILHNGKYDYQKANYVNNITRLCIICPEHGEFWQTPKQHLRGQGCPLCGKKKTRGKSDNYDNSKKLFLKKINEKTGTEIYKKFKI